MSHKSSMWCQFKQFTQPLPGSGKLDLKLLEWETGYVDGVHGVAFGSQSMNVYFNVTHSIYDTQNYRYLVRSKGFCSSCMNFNVLSDCFLKSVKSTKVQTLCAASTDYTLCTTHAQQAPLIGL